ENRGAKTGANRSKALPTDHLPMRLGRVFPDQRSNLTKSSREHPHGDADVDASPNQPTAATHLNGDIDSDEPGNQRDDEEYRINASHQQRSPQARENRRVKPMVLAE